MSLKNNNYGLSLDEITWLSGLKDDRTESHVRYEEYISKLKRRGAGRRGKGLFIQSDKSLLRYAFPEDMGGQYAKSKGYWKRTFSSGRLFKKVVKKEGQPKLGLWSAWLDGSNLILVAADFDKVPKNYKSFDELEIRLKELYDKKGIVIRTASKKCKILFQIKVLNYKQDHTQVSLEALESLLDKDLFDSCDKCKSALSIVFITPENVKTISDKLKHLKPAYSEVYSVDSSTDEAGNGRTKVAKGVDIVCSKKTKQPLRKYEGVISGRLGVYAGRPIEPFLRSLMCSERLLTSMQISQRYFAEELGVQQSSICRYISTLRKDGVLARLKGKYKKGVRACKYKAKGSLRDYLENTKSKAKKQPYQLPQFISEGEWNKTLYAVGMSHFKNNPKGFREWAQSLEGADKNDRPRQIKNIYTKLKHRGC